VSWGDIVKGMYRRKAGRVVEVEDEPDHDDDEESDPELVRALDDLKVVPDRPVASTPLVKKGKWRAFEGGTPQTAVNRKPGWSKRGTVNVRAPRKGGRTMPPSQVEESESEREDFSALLDAVGAISTDEDGVPYFPSASQPSQSSTKPSMSKGRSRASVRTQGAGRGRGFATISRLKVARNIRF
jgi:hypothetical protein